MPRRTYFICAEDIFGQLRSGRRATSVDDGDVEEWGQLVEDLSVFDSRSEKLSPSEINRRSASGFCASEENPCDGTYIPISAAARDKMLLG